MDGNQDLNVLNQILHIPFYVPIFLFIKMAILK